MRANHRVQSASTRGASSVVLTAVVVAFALALGACGDDDASSTIASDPAAVLESYRTAYNSGDIDAAMALFSDGSIIEGHPLVANQTGLDEIRGVLVEEVAAAATVDAYVFSNVEVDGATVSWDQEWTNRDGNQFCHDGHIAVVEGGRIMSWAWPAGGFGCS